MPDHPLSSMTPICGPVWGFHNQKIGHALMVSKGANSLILTSFLALPFAPNLVVFMSADKAFQE